MRTATAAAVASASTLVVCVVVSVLLASMADSDGVVGALLRFRGTAVADSSRRLLRLDSIVMGSRPTSSSAPVTRTSTDRPGAGRERIQRSGRRCSRMAPWGDVCVYDNACFGEGVVKFIDPDKPPNARVRGRRCHPFATLKCPLHFDICCNWWRRTSGDGS